MFEETTAASHALISEADALSAAVAQFDIGGTHPVDVKSDGFEHQPNRSVRAAAAVVGAAAIDLDVDTVAEGSDWKEF